ncbi:MAG TPA: hypothetical protein VF773_18500 [Verrucomicrobiae bacterium]
MKKQKRPHSCNVLEASPVERHLWHFTVARDDVKLQREETIAGLAPLPPRLVTKDWHELFQPKLNIAWLPAESVFLRVVQLPAVDRAELMSMLEFQIERLSPLPVAQIVWSAEVLPSAADNMQTAIVCIVSRDKVEEFLGTTEAQNYFPDRLEVPQLNQILSDGVREDGAWIYLGSGAESDICTVAWWSAGTLRELHVVRLPHPPATSEGVLPINAAEYRSRFLQDTLMQVAWAGELEGWLATPLQWHFVADDQSGALAESLFAGWTDAPPARHSALDRKGLARFSAKRAAEQQPSADLLPVDFANKYRQQYVDRLWMRGLGAVVALYVAGVFIYMIALQVVNYQASSVKTELAGLGNSYTNVLRLKERVAVLQEQLNLKYAALDCIKLAAEHLPADFNLVNLRFSRDGTLQLIGTAPTGQEQAVIDYNEAIRNATLDGKKMFRDVSPPNFPSRAGSQVVNWNFDARLNLLEPLK